MTMEYLKLTIKKIKVNKRRSIPLYQQEIALIPWANIQHIKQPENTAGCVVETKAGEEYYVKENLLEVEQQIKAIHNETK